jgi:hypothetical protein
MSTPSSFHGELLRVLLGETLICLAADADAALAVTSAPRELPVDRVVLEQVRQRLRVGQIVDGDDLEVRDLPLGERAARCSDRCDRTR